MLARIGHIFSPVKVTDSGYHYLVMRILDTPFTG